MRDTSDNIGGIGLAWIALAAGTVDFPAADSALTISPADFDEMDEIPVHPYRAGYKESASETDQGILFAKTFDTGIPSDIDLVRNLMAKYRGQDTLLIFQDLEFNLWLVFDRAEPGKFLSEFSSGVDPVDGKNHTVTISNSGTWARKKLTLL